MSETIQLIIAGIENGLAYGLVALALIMIFKTANVLNFAQGTLAGLSGYLAYWFFTSGNFPWPLAALAALACAFLIGIVMERIAVRPLIQSGFFSIVIATLAVDAFATNAIEQVFGTDPLPFPPPIAGAIDVGGVRLTHWSIVIMITAVVVLSIITALIQRTELGLAMRAFADDQTAAQLMGVSEAYVSRMTWGLSTAVGGVVGIVLAPVLFLQTGYMNGTFINGLTAAILGGFVSLSGGVLGGLTLGLLDAFAVKYAPKALVAALPLLVVLLLLLLRPRGLFNRQKSTERV